MRSSAGPWLSAACSYRESWFTIQGSQFPRGFLTANWRGECEGRYNQVGICADAGWESRVCVHWPPGQTASQVKLVIVEPGHFHASLIQADMYPQVSPRVSVYAPMGTELVEYMNRVAQFNTRAANPTRWDLEVHTGADFFDRMLKERSGNVVVFSGRNREKIGRILRSLEAGYNVFADKPWVIRSEDLPKLEAALNLAESKGLVGYDIMTERYEITSMLQREIVNAPEVFGELVPAPRRSRGSRPRASTTC